MSATAAVGLAKFFAGRANSKSYLGVRLSGPRFFSPCIVALGNSLTSPDAISSDKVALDQLTYLDKEISRHDQLYYASSAPEISDAAYDALLAKAASIESRFPSLKGTVKKLSSVGHAPSGLFDQFAHSEPMLSLQNMFTAEDVASFVKRIQGKMGGADQSTPAEFVIEPKIDGVSLALLYRNGSLVRAGTRGDGRSGEDVTESVRVHAEDIPLTLRTTAASYSPLIEVRGELYMSKETLRKLNTREDVKDFSTARNAASGILRRKSSSVTFSANGKSLNFFAYSLLLHNIGDTSTAAILTPPETQAGMLRLLQELGFQVASVRAGQEGGRVDVAGEVVLYSSSEEVFAACSIFEKHRHMVPYDVDGAVVKLNSIHGQDQLGSSTRFPRWAAAFKFASDEKVTKLRGIGVQVGAKGALTPVAILDPVVVGGASVSRATLHNEDAVNRILGDALRGITAFESGLDIDVIVCRSGDVIPKVIGTVSGVISPPEASDLTSQVSYHLPKQCPSCGSPTERAAEDATVTCTGSQFVCPAQIVGNISNYCSKGAANIKGLSTTRIEALQKMSLIHNIADVYRLGPALRQLLALRMSRKKSSESDQHLTVAVGERTVVIENESFRGWAETSVENLVKSINSSRKISSERFLYGLGLRHVGQETSKDVVRYFGGFLNLWNFVQNERASLLLKKGVNCDKLEPTQQYLSTMSNIPHVSTNAIGSIWRLAAFDALRNMILSLLEEVEITSSAVPLQKLDQTPSGSQDNLEGGFVGADAESTISNPLFGLFKGKMVVITGVLNAGDGGIHPISRAAIAQAVQALGGVIGKSVSKKTDILICGSVKKINRKVPSSAKMTKALAHDVEIWSEGDARIQLLKEFVEHRPLPPAS